MKETFKIHVLGDQQKILNDRYSFIEELKNGFSREAQEREADFFIVDLDYPPDKIQRKMADGIEKEFCCRPIIFASLSDKPEDASAKAVSMIPYLKDFVGDVDAAVPVCTTEDEVKKTLRWFSFLFKEDAMNRVNILASQLLLNKELAIFSR